MISILLVEDEAPLQNLYRIKLELAGYEVRTASDAQTALDVLDHFKVHLIILDLLLPRHNGLMILQELQSYPDWRTIPVMMLSSIPKVDVNVRDAVWEQLNVVRYLYKPTTKPHVLVDAIESLIERHSE